MRQVHTASRNQINDSDRIFLLRWIREPSMQGLRESPTYTRQPAYHESDHSVRLAEQGFLPPRQVVEIVTQNPFPALRWFCISPSTSKTRKIATYAAAILLTQKHFFTILSICILLLPLHLPSQFAELHGIARLVPNPRNNPSAFPVPILSDLRLATRLRDFNLPMTSGNGDDHRLLNEWLQRVAPTLRTRQIQHRTSRLNETVQRLLQSNASLQLATRSNDCELFRTLNRAADLIACLFCCLPAEESRQHESADILAISTTSRWHSLWVLMLRVSTQQIAQPTTGWMHWCMRQHPLIQWVEGIFTSVQALCGIQHQRLQTGRDLGHVLNVLEACAHITRTTPERPVPSQLGPMLHAVEVDARILRDILVVDATSSSCPEGSARAPVQILIDKLLWTHVWIARADVRLQSWIQNLNNVRQWVAPMDTFCERCRSAEHNSDTALLVGAGE